jgi:hypothetical protein
MAVQLEEAEGRRMSDRAIRTQATERDEDGVTTGAK